MPLSPLSNLQGVPRPVAEALQRLQHAYNALEGRHLELERQHVRLMREGITSEAGRELVRSQVASLIGARGQTLIGDESPADDQIENVATGDGTVSSFSATPAAIFNVTNPSTTPALSLDNQSANRVLAGPASGLATTPAFRALVEADLPQAAVKSTNVKVTAGAPHASDGYIEMTVNGVVTKVMTTAG